MRKSLLLTLLALLGMTQMAAQEYEYVPFVREGVKWVYFYDNYYSPLYGVDQNLALGKNYLVLEIKGDTVIAGKSYKAMHKYSGSAIDWDHDTIPIFLREEDKVVYGIVPEGNYLYDCPIGYGPEYLPLDGLYGQIWTGQEFVLYDFADTKSYYESEKMFDPDLFEEEEFSYIGSDLIIVGGTQVKRHVINRWYDEDYIIEGVGFDGHNSGFTLHYFYSRTWAEKPFHLSHVVKDGQIIYKGIFYDPGVQVGINEMVADQRRVVDENYYNLMGQPVGKEVPSTPGIYIHQGRKIVVR